MLRRVNKVSAAAASPRSPPAETRPEDVNVIQRVSLRDLRAAPAHERACLHRTWACKHARAAACSGACPPLAPGAARENVPAFQESGNARAG
jgi:hypothetical protein